MNGEKRNDSYYNTMTGLGKITADKNVHTEIGIAEILTDEYLSQIDISEGLPGVKKACDYFLKDKPEKVREVYRGMAKIVKE